MDPANCVPANPNFIKCLSQNFSALENILLIIYSCQNPVLISQDGRRCLWYFLLFILQQEEVHTKNPNQKYHGVLQKWETELNCWR